MLRSASKIRTNTMKPRNMTSSFSNRKKVRWNPFSRRSNRSTSLRRSHISRWSSKDQSGSRAEEPQARTPNSVQVDGSRCLHMPGHKGQFLLPASQAMEQLASLGRIMTCPGGRRERHRRSCIRGNRMNPGAPSPTGLAGGLRTVFLSRIGSVEMNLHDGAVHRHHFRPDPDELLLPYILNTRSIILLFDKRFIRVKMMV